MNARRRKDLEQAISMLEQAREIIECTREEEQEAYDNLPESIQVGDRACRMYENFDNLEETSSAIDDIIESINEIIEA